MSEPEIEVSQGSVKRRFPIGAGLRAGEGLAVPIEGAAGDELHFQTEPPAVRLVGSRTTALLNGRAFERSRLADGDAIQWCGAVLVFSGAAATLEELPPERIEPADSDALTRVGARLAAGLLVELGLAAGPVARRWQDAVREGGFDADACAEELLEEIGPHAEDPRLLERSARLQRDLLMAPLQKGVRGASRRARGAARGGLAMVLAQGLAVAIYTLLLLAILLLLRVKHDYSLDGFLDSILDTVTPGLILFG